MIPSKSVLKESVQEYLELAKETLGPGSEITQVQILLLALMYCHVDEALLDRALRRGQK